VQAQEAQEQEQEQGAGAGAVAECFPLQAVRPELEAPEQAIARLRARGSNVPLRTGWGAPIGTG
jgi:hypothetical protein